MNHRYYPTTNLVVLFDGKIDPDLRDNLVQFFHLDGVKARQMIRDNYFTIIAHGETDNLAGWNQEQSLAWIAKMYGAYGKHRRIFLLSCDTGWALAQQVANKLRKLVIAPLGDATFDPTTGDITIKGDNRWQKSWPGRQPVTSDSSVLTEEFLR